MTVFQSNNYCIARVPECLITRDMHHIRDASVSRTFLTQHSIQIILRARHNHLISTLRADTTLLTPALIEQVRAAWIAYVKSDKKVRKGLADADCPTPGSEWETWPNLVDRFQDKAWKQAGLQKDEKFEMHFNAAVGSAFPTLCVMCLIRFIHTRIKDRDLQCDHPRGRTSTIGANGCRVRLCFDRCIKGCPRLGIGR